MDEPTDSTPSSPVQDRYARARTRQGRLRRHFPERVRKPAKARRSGNEAWRGYTGPYVDAYGRFHWQMLLAIGGVTLSCGLVSLITLGMDAPGGWELALRLLSAALVAIALAFCILAFRRRHPYHGKLSYTLLAIAALVAGVAVAGIASWAAT